MATGGLYGSTSTGTVAPQSGSESVGLYGNNTVFGGTYFEWLIFLDSATTPATPTGGSWSFVTNVGTPPTGWSNTPPASPTTKVWVSIALVNSKSTATLTWSTPGQFTVPSGTGTVTSVAALTLGTAGTDVSSTVVNPTTTPAITLNLPTASATNRGLLSSTDWTTFNNKGSGAITSVSGTTGRVTSTGGTTPVIDLASGVATPGTTGSATLVPVVTIDTYGRVTSITTAANPQGTVTSVTGTAPVVSSGGATPAISMAAATTSVSGYLSSTDWTTFNGKQSAITLTTTGTSGAATFVGNTLNIPQYSSSGGTGTVTSVAASVPSFLSIAGSPITTSGTLAISYSGTALPVANGGTGVTASSGANSVVLRDANVNISANFVSEGYSNVAAAGTTTTLTVASVHNYVVTGSGGQTYQLPDATTLPSGANYTFNNNQSSGTIVIKNNSGTTIATIQSGGFVDVSLLSNASAAGSWDVHNFAPSNVSWSTNTLDYAGSITSATWNGATVAINRGGTGQTTQAAAITALAGTQVSGQYLRSNGTNTLLSAIQAADVPTLNQNTTGTASNVTGTVAVANGGTGQTTASTAITALTGTQISGYYLRSNGTNAILAAIVAADVPTLNQNTTGTATNVTGTVAIANGGSGQTTAQLAMNAFAGAVTSGSYLRGNGTNVVMNTIQAADVPTLNQNTTGSAGSVANSLTSGTGISFSAGTTYNGSAAITINNSLPMVYPGAGIPNSSGTAWGTSYTTSGSGSVLALATSPSLTTPILGTPQSGNFSTGTFTWPTFNQNTTGTAANVTGTVAIINGGTGQTTASAGFNALSPITTTGDLILGNGTNSATRLGIGTNGYVLTSNGTTAAWAASTGGGSSAYTRTSFTATAGQTAFTVTYSVGYLQVYVNGVLLATSDYTATSGTGFTLGVACVAGDVVEALVITTSVIANGISTGKSIAMAMIFGF